MLCTTCAGLGAIAANAQPVVADWALWGKKTQATTQGTGSYGGGEVQAQPPYTPNRAQVRTSGSNLLLLVEKGGGGIQFTPVYAGLPEDWKLFKQLEAELTNQSTDTLRIIWGYRGKWIRAVDTVTFLPGQQLPMIYPLAELPIAAAKESPYRPGAIVWEVMGNKGDATVAMHRLALRPADGSNPQPVVDRFGQRNLSSWQGKVMQDADLKKEPNIPQVTTWAQQPLFDKYGGNKQINYTATGFFYVTQHQNCWWWVTPEGNAFWSLGVTGIRPKNDRTDVTWVQGREQLYEWLPDRKGPFATAWVDSARMSFYYVNLLRKYGNINSWRQQVMQRLRSWGLNSIGNWSEDSLLAMSNLPFTKALDTKIPGYEIGRGLSDVFHPGWVQGVQQAMAVATLYRSNPYLLGYFVDNEQGWGRGDFAGVLDILPDTAASRQEWLKTLQQYYANPQAVAKACGLPIQTWQDAMRISKPEHYSLLKAAVVDFETRFARKYFSTVQAALKQYDANHLYLGCRFTRQPKPWHIMQAAGQYCDAVTVNVYSFYEDELRTWHAATGKPILIGEHHAPLASTRQFPPNYKAFAEPERQAYYLDYVQRWASMPFSLGCHWYQFADQHLTGRSTDGECQTVGLVDITDSPHRHMIEIMQQASGKMYQWHAQ